MKDLGALIDRYSGKWSQLRVGDQIDTRTASGVLVLNILASVSQWERGVISERSKDALAYKKANREQTGGVPYGWQLARDGVHLDANAKEQAIIQTAHELWEQGLSLWQTGHAVTEQGMYPRSGRAWHPQSVEPPEAAEGVASHSEVVGDLRGIIGGGEAMHCRGPKPLPGHHYSLDIRLSVVVGITIQNIIAYGNTTPSTTTPSFDPTKTPPRAYQNLIRPNNSRMIPHPQMTSAHRLYALLRRAALRSLPQ